MTLLPVVGRELRVAARRPWNYWTRSLSAGVAVVVCAWILLLESGGATPGSLAKQLFSVTSFLAFVYALLAGVVFSADSLAGERREGTLGLLFLTDLRGHDVLLGKLAASSLGCVFHLGAAMPVLAMSMLLGGVTLHEYLRMILVLASTLFLSLAVGMYASTLSADGKRAAAAALGLMIAACGAVPAIGGLAVWITFKMTGSTGVAELMWNEFCSWASPVPLYWWAFDGTPNPSPERFWKGLAFIGAVALGSLALGSHRLPRLWQTKSSGTARRGAVGRIESWRWPTRAARDRFRTRLLEDGPLVWLAGRNWTVGWWVWIFLGTVAVAFLAIGAEVGKDWFDVAAYFAVSMLVHLVIKVWIASEAPRQFLDDRRSGAMELLLSTPLTVRELVDGRIRAVRRQFEMPALAVLAVDCVFLVAGLRSTHGDNAEWAMVWLARMSLLVLDGYALAWTGAWLGLSTRGSRTTLPGLFRIVILPWLILLGIGTLFALVPGVSQGNNSFGVALALCWMLFVIVDLVWMGRARAGLLDQFRELARTRPGEKKSGSPAT